MSATARIRKIRITSAIVLAFAIGAVCGYQKKGSDPKKNSEPKGLQSDPEQVQKQLALASEIVGYLRQANRVDVLSVSAEYESATVVAEKDSLRFHGHRILGRASDIDDFSRSKVVTGLINDLVAPARLGADCFDPAHGLEVHVGDRTVGLLICFGCSWMEFHDADQKSPNPWLPISTKLQPLFDELLADAVKPTTADGQDR